MKFCESPVAAWEQFSNYNTVEQRLEELSIPFSMHVHVCED